MSKLNKSIVKNAALEWLGELGYAGRNAPHLRPRLRLRHQSLTLGKPKRSEENQSQAAREPAAHHAEGRLFLPAEARFDYLLTCTDWLLPRLLLGQVELQPAELTQ